MRDAAVHDVLFFSPDRAFAEVVVDSASEAFLFRVADTPRQLETGLDNFALDLVLFHATTEEQLTPLLEHPLPESLPPIILLLDPSLFQQTILNERLVGRGLTSFIPLPLEAPELLERLSSFFARNPKPPESLQYKRLYRAGEPVFLENEVGHECFGIVSGRVRVCRVIDSNVVHEVNRLGPGEVFGEMALLRSARRSSAALAVDDVIVTVTTRENFNRVVRSNPDFVTSLTRMLKERIVEMERQLPELAGTRAEPREPKLRGSPFEGQKRRFSAGETLFLAGERSDWFFLLEKGTVQIEPASETAGPGSQATLGPGSLLGEVAHLLDRPYAFTATTLEKCVCRVITAADLAAGVRGVQDLQLQIAQGLAAKLQDLLESLSSSKMHEVF